MNRYIPHRFRWSSAFHPKQANKVMQADAGYAAADDHAIR